MGKGHIPKDSFRGRGQKIPVGILSTWARNSMCRASCPMWTNTWVAPAEEEASMWGKKTVLTSLKTQRDIVNIIG